jgi:outer membrane receptor for ferrienterochelin and colicins
MPIRMGSHTARYLSWAWQMSLTKKYTYMKYLVGLMMLLGTFSLAIGQNTYILKVTDQNSNPLPGATVQLKALKINAISDQDGFAKLTDIPDGTYQVEIRFIGFETRTFSKKFPLGTSETESIQMMPHEEEMEEIVVQSNRSSRVIQDTPSRVEVIAGEELAEKGNMKPGDIRMLLNESTGIQTQQTSATSYNSSIRIQGLDGKYTQLLRDGLPLYSGFSGGLSIMQIAPLDLAQVEVIKGSSSTLYGGGAIAGLVNLISKRPTEDGGLDLMLNGTSALGLDASAFYNQQMGNFGTTVFVSYNKGTPYDPADIGLTAIPKFDRITVNPKVFWNPDEASELIVGINWTTEDRLGGDLRFVQGDAVATPYFEKNTTDRFSTQLSFTRAFQNNWNLGFKNSLSFYDRSIELRDYTFAGDQLSSFSELNFSKSNHSSEWIIGLNLWTDKFDQSKGDLSQPLDYTLNTLGAFVQNIWTVSPSWTLESGFRMDHQRNFGIFPLPKVSILFEPNENLTFRLGGGLGYKSPTAFTEDAEKVAFRNVLPPEFNSLKSETSAGTNLDMNYKLVLGEEVTLNSNILLFHTQIQNPLILALNGNFLEFQQAQGKLKTQGVEVNLKWSYRDFKLFTGYTFSDVKQIYNSQTTPYPLVARHRLNQVLMYEKHESFWVGLEAYYFSPQLLSDGAQGKSYWIMGLMSEKKIGERFSVFLNFENFLDTRQTKFDTIFIGTISSPDFRDIYAPVDGFVINGGFKIHL